MMLKSAGSLLIRTATRSSSRAAAASASARRILDVTAPTTRNNAVSTDCRSQLRSLHTTTPKLLPTKTDHNDPKVQAGIFKNPIVHQLWTAREDAKRLVAVTSCEIGGENDNKGKKPSESFVSVTYLFQSDALLWETYRSPYNSMRLGKIVEDLDALAGNIAYFHVRKDCNDAKNKPPLIVTASVDRIILHKPPPSSNADTGHVSDQHMSGQVTWTGTSSMEIRMQCQSDDDDTPWLEAFVTFVTLHPDTKKPMSITPLTPSSDAETAAFSAGADRAFLKKKHRKQSKTSTLDTATLQKANELLDEGGPLLTMPSLADPNSILMQHTIMQNAMIAQPQVQNLHSRIFGGFLLRRALELGYANAYVFGGARPVFLEVDEVSFTSPVDVGDLLVFTSRILYTNTDPSDENTTLLHVEVEAWITEPEVVRTKKSNSFNFTFAVSNEKKNVRNVLPSNIDEAKRMALRMQRDVEQQSRK